MVFPKTEIYNFQFRIFKKFSDPKTVYASRIITFRFLILLIFLILTTNLLSYNGATGEASTPQMKNS